MARTLWAVCFLNIHFPAVACGLVQSLAAHVPCLDVSATADETPWKSQIRCQVHQFFLACHLEAALKSLLTPAMLCVEDTVGPACKAAFAALHTKPSASQQQVSDTLRTMGMCVQDEFIDPESLYSIDMLVRERGGEGGQAARSQGGSMEEGRGERVWAVEFDGPQHFLACGAATGNTLIKRRHLEMLGYTIVSIPYQEWYACRGTAEWTEYLSHKLYAPMYKKGDHGPLQTLAGVPQTP